MFALIYDRWKQLGFSKLQNAIFAADSFAFLFSRAGDVILIPQVYSFFHCFLLCGIPLYIATFDCRVIPLPTAEVVIDYFRWRQEDAHRNSLNAHCYWMLRKEGVSMQAATRELEGKSISYKNELLYSRGIDYDQLPSWQKRGVGLWKEVYEKEGFDPISKTTVKTFRNRIAISENLPLGEEYAEMIKGFLI